MKMSSACLDRNTRWGLRRFIRSLGIVQSASVKLISLHVALVSSLLRTIVSNSNLAAARIEGVVPMRSMYWYIKPISSGVSARSRGSNFAIVDGRTRSAGFSTFWPRSIAQRKTCITISRQSTAVAGAPRSTIASVSARKSSWVISVSFWLPNFGLSSRSKVARRISRVTSAI